MKLRKFNEDVDEDEGLPQRPNMLIEPDDRSINALRQMAERYVQEREDNSNGEVDDDLAEYMLEEVVKAFYGREIFKYLRDRDNAIHEKRKKIGNMDYRDLWALRGRRQK